MPTLSPEQIQRFITDGFVKIEQAFPIEIADECRSILWKATQCDPQDPKTWTQPVIRIGDIGLEPFQKAANTDTLYAAFDQLVGKNNWIPRMTMGSLPIRFPSDKPAGDTGWHVDASFPGEDSLDYLQWRINIHSKGRALLMLFLFSDVSEQDAPTLIRAGSHQDVARILYPHGNNGLSFYELAEHLGKTSYRKEVLATGKAGTVYLCHPFLAHAAQDHHGTVPKFMAQPPLSPSKDFDINRPEHELCVVEKAILEGLKGWG